MTRRSMLAVLAGAGSLGSGGLVRRAWGAASIEEAVLRRKERLIVHSERPLDAETPPEMLDSWITPNSRFYVRSHFYIPQVEPQTWRLSVAGLVDKPLELRLDEINRLPQVESVLTIECAGNGRSYFNPHVAGTQWRRGAVGTARWKGVRLHDVLARAGLKPEAKHLAFDGADTGIATAPDFVRSVPVDKCMHPATLLATHMNGVPIPVEHGFPLRLITPGWEGAASVKWLTRITAIPEEAEGFFMRTAYRIPTHSVAPGQAVDPKDTAAIQSLAVKSLITHASDPIAGAAWAGEADITKVEVSADGGNTWHEAKLGTDQAPFAWRRFSYEWKPAVLGGAIVMSRATDSRGRTQPTAIAWNPSGYLGNTVDSVTVGEAESATDLEPVLPGGAGRQIVTGRCMACHDEKFIVAQHLNPTGWTREVEKMMRWGAPVKDAEKQSLIQYLAEHFH